MRSQFSDTRATGIEVPGGAHLSPPTTTTAGASPGGRSPTARSPSTTAPRRSSSPRASTPRRWRTSTATAATRSPRRRIFSPTPLQRGGSPRDVYGPVPGSLISIFTGGAPTSVYLDLLNGNVPDDVPVGFTTSGAFGLFSGAAHLRGARLRRSPSIIGLAALRRLGPADHQHARVRRASAAPRSRLPGARRRASTSSARRDRRRHRRRPRRDHPGRRLIALHAFNAGGAQARGFPKFHTGWVVFAPAAATSTPTGDRGRGDHPRGLPDGLADARPRRGQRRVVALPPRRVEHRPLRHRHPSAGSRSPRPPGRGRLSFRAPGDDWYNGTPARYRVVLKPEGSPRQVVGVSGAGIPAAGRRFAMKGPAPGTATVRAIDEAGNRGRTVRVLSRAPAGGCS